MILETFPTREVFCDAARKATVIPVGTRILADTETPVSVVARFAESADPLFLLESAEGGERWGRFSFVGISARAHVSVFRDDVVVRQGFAETRTPHAGQPMAVLRALMKDYTLADLPGLPRFCGGLVGYLAYEMAHFFEPRIPNRLPAEKPLAQFVLPDALLVFDNVTHTLTVLALAALLGAAPVGAQALQKRIDTRLAAPPVNRNLWGVVLLGPDGKQLYLDGGILIGVMPETFIQTPNGRFYFVGQSPQGRGWMQEGTFELASINSLWRLGCMPCAGNSGPSALC
jgi:hypothetical protein